MQQGKECVYCGKELPVTLQLYKRKYCGYTCGNKHELRIRKPDAQAKLWQHEPEVFEAAMEMYWSGYGGAAIARQFGIPVNTAYSWIHGLTQACNLQNYCLFCFVDKISVIYE